MVSHENTICCAKEKSSFFSMELFIRWSVMRNSKIRSRNMWKNQAESSWNICSKTIKLSTLNSSMIGASSVLNASVVSRSPSVHVSQPKQPWSGISTQRCGQWSHFSPMTPGRHSHCPVNALQPTPTLKLELQPHAEEREWTFVTFDLLTLYWFNK